MEFSEMSNKELIKEYEFLLIAPINRCILDETIVQLKENLKNVRSEILKRMEINGKVL